MNNKKLKLHKRRNPIAMNPLLKKGGVHEKSKTGKRRKNKNKLKSIKQSYSVDKYSDEVYEYDFYVK